MCGEIPSHETRTAGWARRPQRLGPIRAGLAQPSNDTAQEHPLQPIRKLVDEIFRAMSQEFDGLYAKTAGHRFLRSGCRGHCCADFLLAAQRAAADGTTELQPAMPLSWEWRWTSRCGTARRSARIGSGMDCMINFVKPLRTLPSASLYDDLRGAAGHPVHGDNQILDTGRDVRRHRQVDLVKADISGRQATEHHVGGLASDGNGCRKSCA